MSELVAAQELPLMDCETAKAAGNKAIQTGNFEEAEAHYTAALKRLPDDSQGNVLHTTLLCNRAHARQQLKQWQLAVEDTTAALQHLTDSAAETQKMRVKALYRRALAQESLGQAAEAFQDLNDALKVAPTNDGIIAAAKRIKEMLPAKMLNPPLSPPTCAWVPQHPFCTKNIIRLADSDQFPGRIRGYTPVDSNAVVKFANGMGVAAYHGLGGLCAIWPLGIPRLIPRCRERGSMGHVIPEQGPPELGDDYFSKPNMRPGDGIHLKYSRGGDLRWIQKIHKGTLEGLALRFEPEGFLKYEECGVYQRGRLVEKWQNCLLPEGYLSYVLTDLVVPIKKALGIDLSPCEKRLCYENYVGVDGILPAELNTPPNEKTREGISGCRKAPREWWRPQLEITDPSKVYNADPRRNGEFAPIGPSVTGEVLPQGLGAVPYPAKQSFEGLQNVAPWYEQLPGLEKVSKIDVPCET